MGGPPTAHWWNYPADFHLSPAATLTWWAIHLLPAALVVLTVVALFLQVWARGEHDPSDPQHHGPQGRE